MNSKDKRPENLNMAAVLMIVSGCLNLLGSIGSIIAIFVISIILGVLTLGFGFLLLCCMIFPLAYVLWGITEIIYATRIMKGGGIKRSPVWIGIVEIVIGAMAITSIHGIVILIIGIINTTILSDQKVKDYFERTG